MLKEISFTKKDSLEWKDAVTLAKMLGCMVVKEDEQAVTMITFNGDHVIVEDVVTDAGAKVLYCRPPKM